MKRAFGPFALGVVCAASLLCAAMSARSAETDGNAWFESKIRPLLVERCFECHSEKKHKGGLRLDSKAAWQKGGETGPAVVPGHPESSLLMKAVGWTDKELQMPPKKQLAADEIALLEQWIKMGAPDPRDGALVVAKGVDMVAGRKHWAFQPVSNPEPPFLENESGQPTELDRFILARMRKEKVSPNAQADRRTLIRRATFDLTGLPPTPAEIDMFLKDSSSDAFEKLVNRLLESPAYGERWGRHWLDVARYADTAGDGADYPVREAIKYREWVISAFNADEPYDQFVREQIAGDILASKAPSDQYARCVTATGFLAIGKRYGYKPSPDYQHLDFADAIDSVGRSLLGLSLGCARCHDHKFDPVTSADYYALYGIFKSSQWAFPGGEEQKRPSQFLALVSPEEAARRDQAKTAELARLDAEIAKLRTERVALDGKSFAGGVDLGFEGQALGKPPDKPWLSVGQNVVLAEAQSPFAHSHPPGTRGVRLGSGHPTEGVRYVFAQPLRAVAGKKMHFTIDFRTVAPATKTGAYRFYLGQGVIKSLAVEFSVTANEFALKNGANWEVVRKLEAGKWYTLNVSLDPDKKTFSGQVGAPSDLTAFENKALGAMWDGVADTFICDAIGHVQGPAPERDLDNIGLQENAFGAPGSGPVASPTFPADWKERLKSLDAEIAAKTKAREAEAVKYPYEVAYGVSEGTPTNVRIQKRGEPDKLGDEVPRRFLEILGGDPVPADSKGSGRLELAECLTRPTNPLTARVFVNRVWQWHFGQGLVATPSDFGLRGERPSHPELLDWLATKFMASGWSVKSLHRMIMLSSTYQRASDDNADNLKVDPSNRWLWRFARQPLDAESVRDAMLAISGRLDRTIPGEHPFPPVASWGFTIHKPFHAVYESNHRSVYLMVQRNRRNPFLALFDAADPNISVAQRMPTTTPSQTLFLMNSPFVHEQSDGLAQKLLAVSIDDSARVRLAFETTDGRLPTEAEVGDAVDFVNSYRKKLAELGTPPEKQAPSAWAALARVLLTRNSFLYVD